MLTIGFLSDHNLIVHMHDVWSRDVTCTAYSCTAPCYTSTPPPSPELCTLWYWEYIPCTILHLTTLIHQLQTTHLYIQPKLQKSNIWYVFAVEGAFHSYKVHKWQHNKCWAKRRNLEKETWRPSCSLGILILIMTSCKGQSARNNMAKQIGAAVFA